MPMIDVYAAADLFPAGTDRQLGEQLTLAVLRAEGVAAPGPFHLNNTAAYIHRMPAEAVQTAATALARTVRDSGGHPAPRAQPGRAEAGRERNDRDRHENFRRSRRRPGRTWVILTEAAEGRLGYAEHGFWQGRVRRPRRKGQSRPTLNSVFGKEPFRRQA
jgi:hypothetical protein